jgi:hypothetical protein
LLQGRKNAELVVAVAQIGLFVFIFVYFLLGLRAPNLGQNFFKKFDTQREVESALVVSKIAFSRRLMM